MHGGELYTCVKSDSWRLDSTRREPRPHSPRFAAHILMQEEAMLGGGLADVWRIAGDVSTDLRRDDHHVLARVSRLIAVTALRWSRYEALASRHHQVYTPR